MQYCGRYGDHAVKIQLNHIDEDEFASLHESVSFRCSMAGLKGPALDEAIAAALAPLLEVIERERSVDWKRRETLKLVE